MPPSPYSLLSLLALPAAAATRLLASFFFSAACLCHDSAAERACESLTRPGSSFCELRSDLCSASRRVVQPRGPMIDECRRQ